MCVTVTGAPFTHSFKHFQNFGERKKKFLVFNIVFFSVIFCPACEFVLKSKRTSRGAAPRDLLSSKSAKPAGRLDSTAGVCCCPEKVSRARMFSLRQQ